MSEAKKPRVVLGPKAMALGATISGNEEQVSASQLEEAIDGLHAEIAALEKAKAIAENTNVPPKLRRLIQAETDQLYLEVKSMFEAHNTETVNLLNGIRYMLNVFAEELAGADVDELIKDTNEWLDRTIKPIEQSRKEGTERREHDARLDNENDPGRDIEAAPSQLLQPAGEKKDQQPELEFEERDEDRSELER